jgi:hypothetical protein
MAHSAHLTRRGIALLGLATPTLFARPALAASGSGLLPPLAPLARLVGSWRGDGEGEPGVSTVERSYEAALGGHFLKAQNTSTYAPQPKNLKGEVHQDIGFYSFDKGAKAVVFRQFHVEGYVNQFNAPADSLNGDVMAFTTVAIENIPPGFRARETITFHGKDAFEEVFEIAEPGKPFAVYSHNHMRRVRA